MSGAEGDRTPDLVVANHALSQLSYSPGKNSALSTGDSPTDLGAEGATLSQLSYSPVTPMSSAPDDSCVGLSRVELLTSRLSGVRSNHLSYRPRAIVD